MTTEQQSEEPIDFVESYTHYFSHGSVTLNPEQHRVVTGDPDRHQRILAAAGSGKTTTITARIAWLLTETGVKPDQIVLLTFSRNSARDMLHRVRRLVGPVSLWAGTFHGLAAQILRQMGSNSSGSSNQNFFIDELPVRLIQWLRSEKGRKWVGRIRYIVVDEFQDINAIQWRLLESMRHIGARIILVGDDAQNIYTWRGSSTGFLLEFHKVCPSVADYQLRMNYRSTEAIVSVANRVMRNIPTLPWKEHMIANTKGGKKPDVLFFWRVSDELGWLSKTLHELRLVKPHATYAVLARNNTDLYKAEEILLQGGHRTRFLVHERSEDGEAAAATEGVVDLATFHGSKGLEWDYTFLISLNDDCLPSRKDPGSIIGERRLFYVAVTRARQRMFMTYHGNDRTLSRFVREIGYQHLTFHGLAKYALSEFEVGGAVPSLQSLLDCLDGDEWAKVREAGLLPWREDIVDSPLTVQRILPSGESYRLPSWADQRDFEAFLRLWLKRCLLELGGWQQGYTDPMRERMIFTVRIFQEDAEFWSKWRDEFDQMMRHFFKDLQRMEPADYGDVVAWALEKGLPWEQKELIQAASIIAKLRGQLRPLRFEKYSLDEFTIRPVGCVVPQEYRVDVLRAWRRFVRKDLGWREVLMDTWRLACLEQVAEGRTAGLFRVGAMADHLKNCIPFLESLEGALRQYLEDSEGDGELRINPEVAPEGVLPVSCDILVGRRLLRISGEKKPDMYMWTEACLTAYLFVACGMCQPIKQIQVLHPFHGFVWTFDDVSLVKAKLLYQWLLRIWDEKNA